MFDGNWRKGNTDLGFIIAGLIVASFFLIGAFYSGTITGYIGGHKDYNSAQYSTHANKQIEKTCLLLEPSAMAECIRIIIEATNEENRSERDIVAQETMALWALGVVIISGFGLVVTGVGVWFVGHTLIATQATLAEAERTTKGTVKLTLHPLKYAT